MIIMDIISEKKEKSSVYYFEDEVYENRFENINY